VAQSIMQYINRLSDYLFLLQRKLAQGAEKKWEKPCE
jgi:cob(I)alamin adenosyltransferase